MEVLGRPDKSVCGIVVFVGDDDQLAEYSLMDGLTAAGNEEVHGGDRCPCDGPKPSAAPLITRQRLSD
jgi:hypothetical protein